MLKGGSEALQKAMDGIEECYPKKKPKKKSNKKKSSKK